MKMKKLIPGTFRIFFGIVVKKSKKMSTVILLFVSIFFDNFNLWTYFWFFNAMLQLLVILLELDTNFFTFKKEECHRDLFTGQTNHLLVPLAYVAIALLPQVIPLIENLTFK